MKTYTPASLEDTKKFAHEWLKNISALYANYDEALIVGLSGHLGAGKTAFTKIVAELLGITQDVTSPTFVIMKFYDIDSGSNFPWKRLVHIDAYRLERREDLDVLNFEQLVADKNNLILIEWPENVDLNDFVPHAHLSLKIHNGDHMISVV